MNDPTDSTPDVAPDTSTDTDRRDQIGEAIAEIRREGHKAAFIHAIVDTVAVVMILNLLLSMLGVPILERTIGPPDTLNRLMAIYLGVPGAIPPIRYGTLVALGVGPLVFFGEFLWLVRRPLIERFEAANPSVHETLRTARDAVERDANDPIAQALYADVIDRLRGTSSIGLLNVARIAIAVGVILGAGVAAVQVSIVGLEVDLAGTTDTDSPAPAAETTRTPAPQGLQSGDAILAEPTDVSSGSENFSAEVDSGAGGRGTEQRSYDSGEAADSGGSVDTQRAGYAQPEEVKDAELIRKYASRLSSQNQEETSDNE
ncbi:MAG: hypothetical protein ABEH65_06430 [Halobacteriales archaeon]